MVSLDKLVETLNDNPNVTIELMSHTDSRDTEEYNQDLSQKRAQSVVQYLIEKGIETEGFLLKVTENRTRRLWMMPLLLRIHS